MTVGFENERVSQDNVGSCGGSKDTGSSFTRALNLAHKDTNVLVSFYYHLTQPKNCPGLISLWAYLWGIVNLLLLLLF